MSGSQTRNIAIRLSVEQAEVVRQALQQVGQQGDAALRTLEQGTQRAGASMTGLRVQTEQTGQSTSRLGQVVGQAGFQIQDFAGQVAAGQNALVAFGQQGSQLLGVFGTGGAIAGAVLTVGVLAAQLVGLGSRSDEAGEAAERAFTAMQGFAEQTRTAFDNLNNALLTTAQRAANAANTALQAQRAQAEVVRSGAIQLNDDNASRTLAAQRELEEARRRLARFEETRNRAARGGAAALQPDENEDRLRARIFTLEGELSARAADSARNNADIARANELLARTSGIRIGADEFGPPAPPSGGGRAPAAARPDTSLIDRRAQLFRVTESAAERRSREFDDLRQLTVELGDIGSLTDEALEAVRRRGEQIEDTYDRATRSAEGLNGVGRDLGLTFSSAFEDAIIRGQRFSQVLQGLAQDIARVLIRRTVTEPLGNAVSGLVGSFTGSLFGAPSGAPARAAGGPVWAGQPFMVGEAGPEVFVPDRSGTILPSGNMPGSGGGLVYAPTISVDARGSQLSGPEIAAIVRTASDNARRELLAEIQRSPEFARSIRGR